MSPLLPPLPGYTAQLVDSHNTARCATVTLTGLSERKAKGVAKRMARSCGMEMWDFYPTITEVTTAG